MQTWLAMRHAPKSIAVLFAAAVLAAAQVHSRELRPAQRALDDLESALE